MRGTQRLHHWPLFLDSMCFSGCTGRPFLPGREGRQVPLHTKVSPIERGLNEVPGVFEDVFLAVFLGEDRVKHELLRSVLAVHLDGRLVYEADGPLAVLVDLVPENER